MKALKAIDLADGMRPNKIPLENKFRWLYAMETEVAEMMGLDAPVNPYPEDGDLLLPEGRDSCYISRLCAENDHANKDTALYERDRARADEDWAEVQGWWRRGHRPCGKLRWRTM